MLRRNLPPMPVTVDLPGMRDGSYSVVVWDTREGKPGPSFVAKACTGTLSVIAPDLVTDLALAIRPRA
jgi:hypothetical protein